MRLISVSAARKQLYELVKQLRDGASDPVVLELDGRPVATIGPFEEPSREVRVARALDKLNSMSHRFGSTAKPAGVR